MNWKKLKPMIDSAQVLGKTCVYVDKFDVGYFSDDFKEFLKSRGYEVDDSGYADRYGSNITGYYVKWGGAHA